MYFVNFGPCKCNNDNFFDDFLYKTFAQFILHTFWCIQMHIDAFLLLRAKYAIFTWKIINFAYFYAIKITSLIILCIKHLHISFCTHFEAFWWIVTHSEHLKEIKTTFLIIFCTKKLSTIHSACILMHMWACIKMHQCASKCIKCL